MELCSSYESEAKESQSEDTIKESGKVAPLSSGEWKSNVQDAEPAPPVVPVLKLKHPDKGPSTKHKANAPKPKKAKRKRTKRRPRPSTASVSAVLKVSIVTPGRAKCKSQRPSTPTPPIQLTPAFSPDPEPSLEQLSSFSLLLENRTFVDYFNVFLSLPIFGQHVYYSFLEKTFEFEPPIEQGNVIFIDHHKVLCWLYNRRYEYFKKTSLYVEFLMASELITAKICIQGIPEKDGAEETENTSNLSKNLFGSVVGMMLFRESLRDTCGESVLSCWKDIARWRCLEDHNPDKHYLKNQIKAKYISDGSTDLLPKRLKKLVLEGSINAEILPDEELLLDILERSGFKDRVFVLDSESSFIKFQKIIMYALTVYWVKRYVVRLQTTVPLETLRLLSRPPLGEEVSVAQARKLRCLQMFPSVFLEADIDASLTSIQVLDSTQTTEEVAEHKISEPVKITHAHATSEIKQKLLKRRNPVWSEESLSSNCLGHEHADEQESAMWKTLTGPQSHKTCVPMIVSTYMTGTRNRLSFGYPYSCNRIMWSLSSDILSGSPFKTYLKEYGQALDMHYLQFWTDVRNYLSADDSSCDVTGNSCKKLLFYKIAKTYLMSGGEASDIFSESRQMSLLWDLSNHNDTSLMHVANDIVIQALWEPMQSYIRADRKTFLDRLRKDRSILTDQEKQKLQAGLSVDQSAYLESNPMYSFNVENRVRERTEVPSCHSSHVFYIRDSAAVPSRAESPKQDHTLLLKEQMWRALEFAILCTEYGTKGMGPQVVPNIDSLVAALHGDYGSLHIRKQQPAVRNDWLRWLLRKPKIDIENIHVSREVISEKLLILPKKPSGNQKTTTTKHLKRRNAIQVRRPPKPRSMQDIVSSKEQYDFFKRFMALNNASMPLLFWRAVEDLKHLPYVKNRRMRVVQIFKKFFGQSAQYGAVLDCDEDIIKQLPFLDKVTADLLYYAQNAVYVALEKKWFYAYLATFPPEGKDDGSLEHEGELNREPAKEEMLVGRPRKQKKKRSFRTPMDLWRGFCRTLVMFRRALNQHEIFTKLQTYVAVKAELKAEDGVAGIRKGTDGKKIAPILKTNPEKIFIGCSQSRLPQDLCFWMEILRYMDLVDSVKVSGGTSADHAQILSDKATAIVTVYLESEVPPKVQVNITEEMALDIINSLISIGPTRGLFHEAVIQLFPLLYVSWKKFSQQERAGTLPDEYFLRLFKKITPTVTTSSPHKNEAFPDYMNVNDDRVTIIHGPPTMFEEGLRITFSIMEGIQYIISSMDDLAREREELRIREREEQHKVQKESPSHLRSRKQSGDGRFPHFSHADSLALGEQDRSKRRRSSQPSSQTALHMDLSQKGLAEGKMPKEQLEHRGRRLSKLLEPHPIETTGSVRDTRKRQGDGGVSKP